MRVSRTRFAKRRLRKKTSFPVVAIIQKKTRPQYNVSDWSVGKGSTTFLNKIKDIKEESPNVLRNRILRSVPPKKSRATIDYKNVVLLRKLITAEGKILPRRINKLTAKQQRHTAKAIKSARVMGLLPFINKSRPLA